MPTRIRLNFFSSRVIFKLFFGMCECVNNHGMQTKVWFSFFSRWANFLLVVKLEWRRCHPKDRKKLLFEHNASVMRWPGSVYPNMLFSDWNVFDLFLNQPILLLRRIYIFPSHQWVNVPSKTKINTKQKKSRKHFHIKHGIHTKKSLFDILVQTSLQWVKHEQLIYKIEFGQNKKNE